MVKLEQSDYYPVPPRIQKNRRFAPLSIRRRLLRALIVSFYLPVVLLARWLLTTAHLHGEARTISVTRKVMELPQLPASFDGLQIAFLTDFHCSALTPPAFLERVVTATNNLKPDVILLGGDYITEGTAYLGSVEKVLAQLKASLGVYSVLGNHDYETDPNIVRSALKRAGIVDVTNSARQLTRGDSRIRIAGVGDLWEDEQDLEGALSGADTDDCVILLSHNPDYAMQINDPRVRIVLSGHTHGGQIHLPRVGALITNSKHGRRLVSGLVSFDTFQLYISRGVGTVMVPFRHHCPPEITLLTLRHKQ